MMHFICYNFFCCCFNERHKSGEKIDNGDNVTLAPLTEFDPNNNYPMDQFKFNNLYGVNEWRKDNNKTPQNDLYIAQNNDDGYIHIYKKQQLYDRYEETEGWKIHVSINTEISGNLGKTWDIIMPILMRYGVYHYKLVAPSLCIPNELKPQLGKEIVIYKFDSRKNIPWKMISEEIYQQLKCNKIVPGIAPRIRCKINNNSNKKIILSEKEWGKKGEERQINEYLYEADDSKTLNDIMGNNDTSNESPEDVNSPSSTTGCLFTI